MGTKALEIGTEVRVRPAMRGQDGFAGEWFVVGHSFQSGSGLDYKLAKHPKDEWEVWIHESRIEVL